MEINLSPGQNLNSAYILEFLRNGEPVFVSGPQSGTRATIQGDLRFDKLPGGIVTVPLSIESVDLDGNCLGSELQFQRAVVLRDITFRKSAFLDGAHFGQSLSLEGSTILQHLTLNGANVSTILNCGQLTLPPFPEAAQLIGLRADLKTSAA